MKSYILFGSALCILALIGLARGTEYYVSTDGKPDAVGSKDDPWDITSALENKHSIAPGDTIWLRGGKYRSQHAYKRKGMGFRIKLIGTAERPIYIRAWRGERVTIDGGIGVVAPSEYVWLWDLEITVAPDEEVSRETRTPGSHPGDLGAPYGGINIYAGKGCKYINLIVHDNFGNGVGWWSASIGGEMYGCIIVNNGWKGPDRCHGHCIYAQNKDGVKIISNCIMTTRWGKGQYTMHAYGSSRAYVDNFVIEDNICYGKGTFLVGGGRPSRNIVVRGNWLYNVPMQIGYSAPYNEDCKISENIVVNAGITVKRYKKALVQNNLIANGRLNFEKCEYVEQKDNSVLTNKQFDNLKVLLLPNKYDPNRANLAIYNPKNAKQIEVKVSSFLKPQDKFRLMHPERFFGEPILDGTCEGETITVPMEKPFATYVLLKN